MAASKKSLEERRLHAVQNVLLIWIDGFIREDDPDCRNTLHKLRAIVNDLTMFQQISDCVRFLKKIHKEKVLIITSGALGQSVTEQIHSMKQVAAIYVFCQDVERHKQWAKKWSKIKDVYDDIQPICRSLTLAIKEINESITPISFVNFTGSDRSHDVDRLEPSFMYTKIFKHILLEMKHDQSMRHELVRYCRTRYSDNPSELQIIDEFEKRYQPDQAVWWYTRECFVYQLLNRALRLLESDVIVNMGFFIHDLHRQIEKLHGEQRHRFGNKPFVLYRGQVVSSDDWKKMRNNRGALISFNSFLSTSEKFEVALSFTQRAMKEEHQIGIIFILKIDPRIVSTPFAAIGDLGYTKDEEEIIFSMHTIFRIEQIEQKKNDSDIFHVHLSLTSDDDQELNQLTNQIEKEVKGRTGWNRLGRLLIRIGKLDQAEELYETLLEKATSDHEKAHFCDQLGWIKDDRQQYDEALHFYHQALEIKKRKFASNDPMMASSYMNIGSVYMNMGQLTKALSLFEQTIEIQEKHFPADDQRLACTYNNLGLLYKKMHDYSKAVLYYKKALNIKDKHYPSNHPSLAVSYNNIGGIYYNMKRYSDALVYLEKALSINEKVLPVNHPVFATAYGNLGRIYYEVKEYQKALTFLEKAREIFERASLNHSELSNVLTLIEKIEKKIKDSV